MALRSDPNLAPDEKGQVHNMDSAPNLMICGRKRGKSNVICTISRARIYRGFFGHIYVKKKTTYLTAQQEGKTPIGEEVGYLLYPMFVRAAIEFHQVNIGGKLSRSLRYCPIIPDGSEIFKICAGGDLVRFRQAVTRQEVPIHAQLWNGWTLLHIACLSGSVELCSLLIELGVDARQEDIFGQKALHIFSLWRYEFHHGVEAMVRLMIAGQEHVEEDDLLQFAKYYLGPSEGFECMLSQDVLPMEHDWRRLPLVYLLPIMRNFAMDVPGWTNLVCKMVHQAEDLHCLHTEEELGGTRALTLLDQLFRWTVDPIKGAQVSEAWLEILVMEGFDVREYLKVEMELHEDNYTPPSPYWWDLPERFLVFDVGQKPNVRWDWWIDPDEPASLVCEEFKHMACRHRNLDRNETWVQTWPFIIPKWAGHLDFVSSDPADNRLWRHMIDLANSRAARRVAKKEMKAARAAGTYSKKRMPGSWID